MKYLLPSPQKLTIWSSLAHKKTWRIDGLIVLDNDIRSIRLHRAFDERLMYEGARSVHHAAARFETLKALDSMIRSRYKWDRFMKGVWLPVRRLLECDVVPTSAERAYVDALDQCALRLGLLNHYGVRAL